MFPYRHMALYGWGVTLFSVSVFTPLPSSCPLSVSLIHSRRHPQPTPPPHCLHGSLCKHMKCCHLVTWAECDQGQAGCRDQMEEFKLWSLDHAPLGSGLNFYLCILSGLNFYLCFLKASVSGTYYVSRNILFLNERLFQNQSIGGIT